MLCVLFTQGTMAQSGDSLTIPSIPYELHWGELPQAYTLDSGVFSIQAGPKSDMFINPQGIKTVMNAPRALFLPEGDFQLYARVEVDFNSDFDAGVLMLYANEQHWAKLCFEYSPQRQPMVVSVVTRDRSDDANGMVIDGSSVYLRISTINNAYAFHYSLDGEYWHFARHFHLAADNPMHLGFASQSPTGEACTARFSEIHFKSEKLKNLRDGT